MKASIITIGDELLIGQVLDTNSAWMAQELNKIGIAVIRRVAVGDHWDEIWLALEEEKKRADLILITGGLGPTADDITKPLLCQYFNGKMVVNEEALAHIKHLFERVLNRPMLEANLRQAEVPDVCTVIQNKKGTAPGMWFEENGKVLVSMPGVPFEMQGMMQDVVLPGLSTRFRLPYIAHRTLVTAGIGESYLAEKIRAFETALPPSVKLAYLPGYGIIRLRLSTTGTDRSVTETILQRQFDTLQLLVKDYLVTNEDESLEQTIGKLLKAKNKSVATAESCTGGYVAHLLTTVPGASAYFKGSIVSYDNTIKQQLLHVSSATLEQKGAVSEETVIEMVRGALQQLRVDYAVAVSGILGPGGGTLQKPVGTVWLAAGKPEKIVTQQLSLRFDRQQNTLFAANHALNLLRRFIHEN